MIDRSMHIERAQELAQELCNYICNHEDLTQAAYWYAMAELGGLERVPEESEEYPDKLLYDAYWTKVTEFQTQVVTITANMLSGLCLVKP